ncbi:cytochrome P450 [Mycena galericulata]|nr:cytochrome P450 [Mycena galericulata]
MQIVTRTSNRLFVGLPLCRDQEFLDMALKHTVNVFTRGQIIGVLPGFLKPILGPFIATRKNFLRHALKFLGPIINERLKNEQEYGGNWPERPNDLISWLLERAEGEEPIHTTTMTLTSALYDLTAYPEHMLPMREEVERVVAKEGWSKASVSKMYKIDSFIRESQRLTIGPVALARKVVAQDGFTFSDGTQIPYGAILTVTGGPAHSDTAIGALAGTFIDKYLIFLHTVCERTQDMNRIPRNLRHELETMRYGHSAALTYLPFCCLLMVPRLHRQTSISQ